MTNQQRPRMCIDRVIPFHLEAEARTVAVTENPGNAATSMPFEDPSGPVFEKIALLKRSMWAPGRTLRVRFLDGTSFLHNKVRQFASEWTKHANLSFEFIEDDDAEIRISFTFEPGSSWSGVGTDNLVEKYFPKHQPTMNFGWFDDNTDDMELSRVIIHEFGHAIGCIHEHQNPKGGLQWNEAAVLAYFKGPPNFWNEDTIRFNVLDRYSQRVLNASQFDPDSIMLYEFPASFMANQKGTHSNMTLSTMDIAFIRRMYPGR